MENSLDSKTFQSSYYLKEELEDFCRKNGLQITGGKQELINRISQYLDTGKKIIQHHATRRSCNIQEIQLDTLIEDNFVCSEKHRAFYKEQIGKSFSFCVTFQKWLKSNAGKTYQDLIQAYHQILEDKKKTKTTIDTQFEYNTYITDFFADNKNKILEQAI